MSGDSSIFTLGEQPSVAEVDHYGYAPNPLSGNEFEQELEQPFFENARFEGEDHQIGDDVALGEVESEAQQSSAGGRLIVEKLPLLRSHAGTPPDLVLFWNGLTAGRPVDVVVHLHGFSGRGRGMRLTRDMIPVSGLDVTDPDNPSAVGRTTPTVLVLPRGHFFGGRSGRGYTFPALHPPGALTTLVNEAVAQVGTRTGLPLTPGRLILTAHSGGGASLMRVLRYADPDEVHTFDALYTDPSPLIAWARKRIGRGSGALRVVYRPREGTARNSGAVREALARALAASGGANPRFRVEGTSVSHMQIPRRFGWRLLADVSADLPGAGSPRAATPARETFDQAGFYEAFDEHEGLAEYEGIDEHEGLDEYEGVDEYEGFRDHEAGEYEASEYEGGTTTRRRSLTTSDMRRAWSRYACAERQMVWIQLLSHRTPVNPLTVEAFAALGQALLGAGYQARRTWVYNCRDIKQTDPAAAPRQSLHAYGLAVDIDARTNPHRRKVSGPIVFSTQPTQAGREQDVKARRAGTAFTPQQVAAVEAIRTVDGLQVFSWGGRWRSSHDAMHFEIRLTPQELGRGLAAPFRSRPAAQEGEVRRTCEAFEPEEHETLDEFAEFEEFEAQADVEAQAEDEGLGQDEGLDQYDEVRLYDGLNVARAEQWVGDHA